MKVNEVKFNNWVNLTSDLLDFINSLALGKQKPLAKNKQNDNKCKCKRSTFTRIVTSDYEPQCGKCWEEI